MAPSGHPAATGSSSSGGGPAVAFAPVLGEKELSFGAPPGVGNPFLSESLPFFGTAEAHRFAEPDKLLDHQLELLERQRSSVAPLRQRQLGIWERLRRWAAIQFGLVVDEQSIGLPSAPEAPTPCASEDAMVWQSTPAVPCASQDAMEWQPTDCPPEASEDAMDVSADADSPREPAGAHDDDVGMVDSDLEGVASCEPMCWSSSGRKRSASEALAGDQGHAVGPEARKTAETAPSSWSVENGAGLGPPNPPTTSASSAWATSPWSRSALPSVPPPCKRMAANDGAQQGGVFGTPLAKLRKVDSPTSLPTMDAPAHFSSALAIQSVTLWRLFLLRKGLDEALAKRTADAGSSVPLEVWYAEQKRSVLLAGDLAAEALSSGEMGPAVREVVGQWFGQGEGEREAPAGVAPNDSRRAADRGSREEGSFSSGHADEDEGCEGSRKRRSSDAWSSAAEEMCWEGEPSASEEAMAESEPSFEGDEDSVMDFITEFELPSGSDEDSVMEDADEWEPSSEGDEDSEMAYSEDEVWGDDPDEYSSSDEEAAPLGHRWTSALPPTSDWDDSD